MGYRRALIARWSRRDRLAVLVVAVTVAFLTGATVLVLAAGSQTAAIAAQHDSPATLSTHPSVDNAEAAVSSEGIVLPVARVQTSNGTTVVVGVPEDTEAAYGRREVGIRGSVATAPQAATLTVGTIDERQTVRFEGQKNALSVDVSPRQPQSSILPPSWYAADVETVERFGPTGAFVIEPQSGDQGATTGPVDGVRGVPLVSALAFFVTGTRQAIAALWIAVGGGAMLVAVTVFSVTRMSVRDRIETIRLVRATGGTPRTVLGLFTVRALGVTAVGTALGYALGVIVTNAAVNLAVAIGWPTSLSLTVTRRGAVVLAPAFVAVVAVGGMAGFLAAWPAVRRPPARLTGVSARTNPARGDDDGDGDGLPATIQRTVTPRLLDWRALVPSAATLTAFVAFVVLIAAMAGVAGPMAATGGATIMEPGSTHPIASQVPTAYADALTDQGIAASPEILLFAVIDGEPVPARGAHYDAFATVTDADLVAGRQPRAPDEAVIGVDLARTLDVERGDRLTLGGSTRASVAQVTVVGMFAAPGPFDDQLVVSLPLARHLSTVRGGEVNFVRAERLPGGEGGNRGGPTNGSGVAVADVTVPDHVVANASFEAALTLRNDTPSARTTDVRIQYRGETHRIRTTVQPTSTKTVRVTFDAGSTGNATLHATTAGGHSVRRAVTVVPRNALTIRGLPTRAPSGSAPLVTVTNATGHPVGGVSISVDNRSVETASDGTARVPLQSVGMQTVEAQTGARTTSTTVRVTDTAARTPTVDLAISPSNPGILVRPTARVRLYNPWNETMNETVTIEGPGGPSARAVHLDPGNSTTIEAQLARQPPGEYDVTVRIDDRAVASTTYGVRGDERVVSALASGGRTGTTGIGEAVDVAFGNLRLVLGALVFLAGGMTVGGTTAVFAQAVHARRRTIGLHRATGASPLGVLRLVVGDALRIGMVGTAVSLVIGVAVLQVIDTMGRLVVFGVRLSPTPSPGVLLGTMVGALGLTVLGAGIATLGLLRKPPARLLSGEPTSDEPGDEPRPTGQHRTRAANGSGRND